MTIAVCYRCGSMKFGAFVPCPECHGIPHSEDDLALSLAMTDHYFDKPTLEQMGDAVREGNPPHLDPQSHAQIIDLIRNTNILAKLQEMSNEEHDPNNPKVKEESNLPDTQ